MSTETKLCCGPRFGVFVDGKCVTCGAPEDTPEAEEAESMEYEALVDLAKLSSEVQQQAHAMRDVLKQMRFAVNALDDGLPRLAQEILGDALRQYGEEQP